jgi:hypothetical protein
MIGRAQGLVVPLTLTVPSAWISLWLVGSNLAIVCRDVPPKKGVFDSKSAQEKPL